MVELPAFQNDVLHALALTGGFTGSGRSQRDRNPAWLSWSDGLLQEAGTPEEGFVVVEGELTADGSTETWCRSPALVAESAATHTTADMVLQTGDIVFMEPRESDLFYTGGTPLPGSIRYLATTT